MLLSLVKIVYGFHIIYNIYSIYIYYINVYIYIIVLIGITVIFIFILNILGLLPYIIKSGLISPIDTFQGYYFSEELRFAYENGYKIIVLNGY
jgi:hypothetical protein